MHSEHTKMLSTARQCAKVDLAPRIAEIRNEYSATRNSRFRPQPRGISNNGSGADYHYKVQTDYMRMVERSRDYDRNNMVVGQGVNRLVDNVLQDGFSIDIETGRKTVDRELSERWLEWTEDPEQCDYEGEKTFHEMERLTYRHTIVDGDHLMLPLADYGSIQLAEGHRLRSVSGNYAGNVVLGVEMADSGRRIAYWVTKRQINPHQDVSVKSDFQIYPARDDTGRKQVFHVYDPRRTSQTRGVTAFAPIVDALGMHDDIQFAKLVQSQMVSAIAILEEQDSEPQAPPGGRAATRLGETRIIGSDGQEHEGISAGLRVRGAPGVKLTGFSPNVPNAEFFDHAHLVLTFISINLGLPVAVLLLDPTKTNFSGWRGAIDQARVGFKQQQHMLIRKVNRPVYLWKARQWAMESPRLESALRSLGPQAFFRHSWNPPAWRYIEPLKDAQADLLITGGNLNSQRRRMAERGLDFEKVSTEIVADRELLIAKAMEAAQRLGQKFPDFEIDWRELAYGHEGQYQFRALRVDDNVSVTSGESEQ